MTNQQGAPEALYASAMEFAAEKASISYVQRKCRCSWNDAEQMLERMVREGIIATYNGRKSAALVEAQQPAPSAADTTTVPLTPFIPAQRARLYYNRPENVGKDASLADWHRIVQYIEAAHDIKGGQHD